MRARLLAGQLAGAVRIPVPVLRRVDEQAAAGAFEPGALLVEGACQMPECRGRRQPDRCASRHNLAQGRWQAVSPDRLTRASRPRVRCRRGGGPVGGGVLGEDLAEYASPVRGLLLVVAAQGVGTGSEGLPEGPAASARAHAVSLTGSCPRNACRPSAVSNVHAIARSQAGSPTPQVPKSMTAANCASLSRRFPSTTSPRNQLSSPSQRASRAHRPDLASQVDVGVAVQFRERVCDPLASWDGVRSARHLRHQSGNARAPH
jgi:hypothetical protein